MLRRTLTKLDHHHVPGFNGNDKSIRLSARSLEYLGYMPLPKPESKMEVLPIRLNDNSRLKTETNFYNQFVKLY